ncbi:hypothetical protein BGX38DRAFT_1189934 [Terfezia claveryi]|nr:hypothetical protein BGX38DRAFT_1189934 [Terfezia claveryi]
MNWGARQGRRPHNKPPFDAFVSRDKPLTHTRACARFTRWESGGLSNSSLSNRRKGSRWLGWALEPLGIPSDIGWPSRVLPHSAGHSSHRHIQGISRNSNSARYRYLACISCMCTEYMSDNPPALTFLLLYTSYMFRTSEILLFFFFLFYRSVNRIT